MRRSATVLQIALVGFLLVCVADANPVQGRSLPEEIPSLLSVNSGVTAGGAISIDGEDRKLDKRNLEIVLGLLGHGGGGYQSGYGGSYYGGGYPEYYSGPEYYYPAYPAPYYPYYDSDHTC